MNIKNQRALCQWLWAEKYCFELFCQHLPRNPSILEEWTGWINRARKYDCAYLSNPRAWGQLSGRCLLFIQTPIYNILLYWKETSMRFGMRLWFLQLPRPQLLSSIRNVAPCVRSDSWGRRHTTVDYVFTYRLYVYHRLIMEEMASVLSGQPRMARTGWWKDLPALLMRTCLRKQEQSHL